MEQMGVPPPPVPPAMVQKAVDTRLTFEDIYNFIKEHEGYRPHVYTDTVGKPTVGIGVNLKRADAPSLLSAVGANYADVLSGRTNLTDQQIRDLFKMTIGIAYRDAKKYIPRSRSITSNKA